MQRIYLLNGREIPSNKCDGFLHVAKKDWGDCIACGNPLKKRQKRVRMNVFGADEPMHFECYLADHQHYDTPTILAVKIEKRFIFGVLRTFVICKEFTSAIKRD